MQNARTDNVLIHVPVEFVTVRINGADQKCLRFSDGFSWAEFDDGNVHPISNPLQLFMLDVTNNAPGGIGQSLYFTFESGASRSSEGQGQDPVSGIDITHQQLGLG